MKSIFALLITFAITSIAAAATPQHLEDFQRVVIADDALAVQRAAAEELANFAGRIVGRKLERHHPREVRGRCAWSIVFCRR